MVSPALILLEAENDILLANESPWPRFFDELTAFVGTWSEGE